MVLLYASTSTEDASCIYITIFFSMEFGRLFFYCDEKAYTYNTAEFFMEGRGGGYLVLIRIERINY